jgi:hypothetical protein
MVSLTFSSIVQAKNENFAVDDPVLSRFELENRV